MDSEGTPNANSRLISRRNVLGGSLGMAALGFAYAAFGDQLASGTDDAETAANAAPSAVEEEDPLQHESARVSHLLRRSGFGVSREEFDYYQSMGLEATLSELINYDSVDDELAISQAASLVEPENPGTAVSWWVSRIINSRRPLQEKLTLFWHGLLTSQISVVKDPEAMITQNELLRANAMGDFPTVLKAITADPAMMVYLDISGSTKQAPNENYARELMELFSMGEGTFTETDVREAARAFTGWRVPRQRSDQGRPQLLEPVFQARRFDDGLKTFLGHTGNYGPDEIIDIIVEQPASAEYVVSRLFAFFVFPEPDASDLAPFVDVYLDNGYSIAATVESMLRSEVFYSPRAYRAIVKSPVEYAVGALKALNLQDRATSFLAGRSRRDGGALLDMGQVLMEPPNVAGWPGGAAWLNSATLFARLNLVDRITSGDQSDTAAGEPDQAANLGTVEQALDHYLPFLLDDKVTAAERQILLDFAGGPQAALTPEALRDLVYIILASPQFQLA